MNRSKLVMLPLTFILGLTFVYFIFFGGLGAAVPVYVLIYYMIAIRYAKVCKVKWNKWALGLLIPILLVSALFILYDNPILKLLNMLFLLILVSLQTSSMFGALIYEPFSINTPLDFLHTFLLTPLCNLGAAFGILKQLGGSKEKYKVAGKIILGLLIALPIMLIVTGLLMSSDAAFHGVISIISTNLLDDLSDHIFKMVFALFVMLLFYALFDGLERKATYLPKDTTLEYSPFIDSIIAVTVASLICIIYIVYCFSQLAYFVSAFQMILPEDFTFAEYTRRGFFELVPLSMLNFALIFSLFKWTKFATGKLALRLFHINRVFISLFSIFLIISTLFKMFMYIGSYGLTPLRVYTTWFLLLMLILFLIILFKLFVPRLPSFKSFYLCFMIMFLALNFMNVDRCIARYNIEQYMSRKTEVLDFDVLSQLSPSAAPEVVKLLSFNNPKLTPYEEKIIWQQVQELLRTYASEGQPNKWQSFNFASFEAARIYSTYNQ